MAERPSRPPSFGIQMRAIADIHLGDRHRRELGDIEMLAASIDDIGLLHPIIIDEGGKLLAGARRLAACQHLGWTHVAVRIMDVHA
jgi:ParB family transcriptional regulator, chromosome partitioning protein